MPELPEVETVCRFLAKELEGKVIKEIKILNPKLRIPIPSNLNTKLKNQKILKILRKGKYIVFEIQNQEALIMHLGMSGRILVKNKKLDLYHKIKLNDKHNHLIINFENGSEFIFNDTRKFGLITLAKFTELNQHKLFSKLGIEPFSEEFNRKKLEQIFKNRTKSIKLVLMDSSLILGIGNIYASEILFRAKIHPEKPAKELNSKNIADIYKQSLAVLEDAIAAGGSTLKDYIKSDGDIGYFQHKFLVYGKADKPCSRCGTPISRIVQSNRSTFFCERCQKN